jgi:hypothetical protein
VAQAFSLCRPPLDGAAVQQRFQIAWRAASGPHASARQIGQELAERLKRLLLSAHQ